MNASGIYVITSPSSGQYIGSALNMRMRWHGHKTALRKGMHKNLKLQNAWNKYGEAAMVFSVMLVCRPCDLICFEQRAIDVRCPRYNICLTAGNSLGVKRTAEYRAAKSQKMRGTKQSPELIAKRAAALVGRIVTPETRAKIGAKHIGNAHAVGCHRSDQTKAKMSASQKARVAALRELGIISRPRLGQPVPQKLRDQISAKLKGRKRSPAAIAKHRATMAARRNGRMRNSVAYEVRTT